MRTGTPVASGPFDLLQEKEHRAGFVIRVPVFDGHAHSTEVQHVSRRFLGSVAVTLRAFDLIAQLTREGHEHGLRFKLTDQGSSIVGATARANLPMFSTLAPDPAAASQFSRAINVYGRKWHLDFEAREPFSSAA